MMYPLVRELADDGIPVSVTCGVLEFSTQAFYAWERQPYSDRDWDDAHLLSQIIDIHDADPTFGYRLIADELETQGVIVGENRVQRLCQSQGVRSQIGTKRKYGKPGPPVHDDLVKRDFTADGPNQLWLADITEHPTAEGKMYACCIKDVWSNRIVGYSISERMTADLAVTALKVAVALRGPVDTIVHTDRGSQFTSDDFVTALKDAELRGSMGRVGTCADNAAMESFFALLQNNVLDTNTWDTRNELRIAIIRWIERTYHRRRRQRTLGKHTPIDYETINQAADAA